MKLNLKKAFLSLTTIIAIIVSSIFPVFGADDNKISLSASKSSIKAGEEVTVTMKISPSGSGVCSFQIDVNYDSSKFDFVSVEKGSGYDYIQKGNGIARVTGYNYDDNNTSASNVATFKFKAKSNASGKGTFSASVSVLSKFDNSGKIVNASYSTSNASVTVNSATTTTTTTKVTTTTTKKKTTTTTTTKKKTTTTTTTKKKTTTTTTTPKKTTTTTTTPKQTTTTTSPVTVSSTTTTTPIDTTSVETTTTTAQTTPEETTTTAVEIKIPEKLPDEYMFRYIYDSVDVFEETEESNFIFDLSDYVDDFTKSYDIGVFVQIDGSVNGAVCYNMNNEWVFNNFKSTDKIAEWYVEDVKLESYDTMIHIPVYFMSTGSTFTIGTIVVWDNETKEVVYNGLENVNNGSEETTTTTTGKLDEILPQSSSSSVGTTAPSYSKTTQTASKSSGLSKAIPLLIFVAIPVLFVIVAVILIIIVVKNIKDGKNNNVSDDNEEEEE